MTEEKLTREQARAEHERAEREAQSGRGFVGLINCSSGFKVFASGMANEDTWFPHKIGAANKAAALSKARAFIAEHDVLDNQGRKARPQVAVCFHVPLESLKAGGENWQQDQWFVTPLYYDAYKEIISPALKSLDIIPGFDEQFWARFGWQAEPGGRTRLNQNDEEVPVLVAYPMAVFADEAAAEEGGEGIVGVGESAPGSAEAPDWLESEIERIQGVVDGMEGAPRPAVAAALAKELGVDADEAVKFIGDDEDAKVEMLAKAYSLSEGVVRTVL